jgi:hypothetical protein
MTKSMAGTFAFDLFAMEIHSLAPNRISLSRHCCLGMAGDCSGTRCF